MIMIFSSCFFYFTCLYWLHWRKSPCYSGRPKVNSPGSWLCWKQWQKNYTLTFPKQRVTQKYTLLIRKIYNAWELKNKHAPKTHTGAGLSFQLKIYVHCDACVNRCWSKCGTICRAEATPYATLRQALRNIWKEKSECRSTVSGRTLFFPIKKSLI